jgi:hypothetical protein
MRRSCGGAAAEMRRRCGGDAVEMRRRCGGDSVETRRRFGGDAGRCGGDASTCRNTKGPSERQRDGRLGCDPCLPTPPNLLGSNFGPTPYSTHTLTLPGLSPYGFFSVTLPKGNLKVGCDPTVTQGQRSLACTLSALYLHAYWRGTSVAPPLPRAACRARVC